jgi:hypothetical protein
MWRAKLSLVVSLGISTLLSEGHYSSHLAQGPVPLATTKVTLGLKKLDSSRDLSSFARAELLSQPGSAPYL